MMGSSMSDIGMYIVLAFAAGLTICYLVNASNLGAILSIGAQWLQNAGMTGKGLIVAFVLFAAFINIFVGSASAKWAIMGPILYSFIIGDMTQH